MTDTSQKPTKEQKAPLTTSKLALKGSSKVVSDYFEYSINSLLYQRGIYPAEDFRIVKKYGINVMLTIDEEVKQYIKTIMKQLHRWVYRGKITKLVVPIVNKDTDEIVERWEFSIEVLNDRRESDPSQKPNETAKASNGNDNSGTCSSSSAESTKQIQKDIQAVIRQITASVTFLPVLQGPHTFNVLVYADSNESIPYKWIDTNGDGKQISDAEVIQFKSFKTDNHKVGTFVSYKVDE